MELRDTAPQFLHLEIEEMTRFANLLVQPVIQTNDDHVFAWIVQRAIDNYHIDPEGMSSKFGVNRSTISRWKAGKNAPQPMARPVIINWIVEQVRAEAKKRKERLSKISQAQDCEMIA